MRTRVLAFCFAVALSISAFGQADRGTITGTVIDPAGAVVANVPVEIRNLGTGVLFPTVSSDTGNYTVGQLPVGNYELTATAPGFKKYVRGPLQVQVAQTIRVDVPLEVGTATESITVSDQASLLKTESGELSHIVTTANMNNLPILSIGSTNAGSSGIRNPNAILRLIPGTYWAPNSDIRINGAPSNTQSYRIEGQEAANTGTPGTPAQNQPGVDAIEELAVQTSNYAAEYGQAGGGYVNITMKSGTNLLHGSAYNYNVNEAYNAGTPFTDNGAGGNQRPRARRNDYGFTVGGPIILPKLYNGRDKTFFFFNWEQFRETIGVVNQQQTVPTAAYRVGNFATAIPATGARTIGTDPLNNTMIEGMIYDPRSTQTVAGKSVRLQFPSNAIPVAQFDPIAVNIQKLIPLPQGRFASNISNNYIQDYPSSRITQVPSLKLDQSIGTKGKLSFFWQRTNTTSAISPTLGQSDGLPDPITTAIGTFAPAPLYRLNYDYTLTPTMLLHLGAGYRETNFYVPSVTTGGAQTNYDIEKEVGLKGGITHRFFSPMTGMLATNGTGGMKNFGSAAGTRNVTQSPTFNASLSWVKGNHTYKFGSEFRTEGYPVDSVANTDGAYAFSAAQTGQPFQNVAVNGANVGFGYASFLLGGVNSVTIANPTNPRLGKKQFGLYAQDTWKITRKMTLDYGLRYDYSTYLQEQYGRAPFFSASTVHPTIGLLGAAVYDGHGAARCNCSLAHNYAMGFGPRLGLAYQINAKTVARAGFGIVYSGTEQHNNSGGGLAGSSATNAASVFGNNITTLSDGIPVGFRPASWPTYNAAQYPTSAPTPGAGPVFMDQNAGRPARQYQWSIGVQRELSANLVVEASYVANRGVWWQAPGLLDVNAIPQSRLAQYNLSLDNAADRTLLSGFLSAAGASQRGFLRPYGTFPTGSTVAQSLRPFPQFTTVSTYWAPLGKTWYDSLQVKGTKRFSHGLSATSTFTWSRGLANGSEREPNPGTTGSAVFNDIFNRPLNKYLSSFDIPFQFILSANYQTPKVSFSKGLVNYVLSDWTYSVVLIYQSGQPIVSPTSQNSPNLRALTFQGTFAERVPGQPLFTQDPNCHCYDPQKTFLLNPAAWTDPPAGKFSSSPAYYTDYRTQRRPNESMNFGRTFRLREKVALNVRAEFSNILNRAYWNNPTATNAKAPQSRLSNGITSSGFGYLNPVQLGGVGGPPIISPRSGSLVARITF
ncbi:MAG: TonB-dependent receptor [Acidobacteriota bacterium]